VSTPARPTNTALWTRESLAQHEVEKLIEVTKRNRPGSRRYAHDLPFLIYRHELRAADCAGSTSTSKRRRHCITVVRLRFDRCSVAKALDRKPPLELFAAVGAGDVEALAAPLMVAAYAALLLPHRRIST